MGHQFNTSDRDSFQENKLTAGIVKQPAVPQSLDNLHCEIRILSETAKALYDRLHPVLRQEPRQDVGENEEEFSSNCMLGDELGNCAKNIKQARQLLQIALRELEL